MLVFCCLLTSRIHKRYQHTVTALFWLLLVTIVFISPWHSPRLVLRWRVALVRQKHVVCPFQGPEHQGVHRMLLHFLQHKQTHKCQQELVSFVRLRRKTHASAGHVAISQVDIHTCCTQDQRNCNSKNREKHGENIFPHSAHGRTHSPPTNNKGWV